MKNVRNPRMGFLELFPVVFKSLLQNFPQKKQWPSLLSLFLGCSFVLRLTLITNITFKVLFILLSGTTESAVEMLGNRQPMLCYFAPFNV